jgi:DNA primase
MTDGAAFFPPLRLYTPRLMEGRDWNAIRARIDLTKVAAALLGPPVERRGLRSGSLGWHCPFHRGRGPSFRVVLGEATWSCSDCLAGGDAAALVMRLKGMVFRDAIAWLDEQDGLSSSAEAADDHMQILTRNAVHVSRKDPSAIGERPAIMERGERPERAPGAQAE